VADFPSPSATPLFLHTWSRFAAGADAGRIGGAVQSASITWPSANQATYIPMWLPWPYLVNRVFWANGSSVTTVNVDFGIYSAADGTLIYSTGSVARSGASASQYVTPTAFVLPPGMYYFGHSCSSTTANRGGVGATTAGTVGRLALAGILQQASALPLPATMSPVTVANVILPLCGVTRTASGF
jgi:hypothetical protein